MLSLTRWNPFEEMSTFHREVNRAFGQPARAVHGWDWVPATEVTSRKEGLGIKMALPGIDPKDVKIALENHLLTITGERTSKEENDERYMSEFSYGSFERSFTVPDNVEGDKVTAKFENGMLELTLPVTEAARARQIEIAA